MDALDHQPHVLRLTVPGASSAQLEAGLSAARDALAFGEVDVAEAFRCNEARAAWRQRDRAGGCGLTDDELQLASIFAVAEMAALDKVVGEYVPRSEARP